MLNVAMLSKWHVHAEGYANALRAMDDVKVTCVWDEDAARGKAWADAMGIPFEASLDALLARPDVDAVAVDAPTNMHCEVMVKAANAKKHIFTEKVMALTVAECNIIAEAVKRNGVKFCISFPMRTTPTALYAKQLIDDGALGDITLMRVRNGHDGALAGWLPEYWYDPATTGGGAMMDLGCHPMYAASWILGAPKRISSMFNTLTGRTVEDNSVCTIEFENKAIAVVETSLVSPFTPGLFELYGTEGTLIVYGNDIKVKSKKFGVQGWVTPDKLPAALPSPLRIFVEGVTQGKDIPFDTEAGTKLTQLMEGAYKAHKNNTVVTF